MQYFSPATRTDNATLRTFARTGTCSSGTCSYAPSDQSCQYGCASGTCKPKPAAGCNDGIKNQNETDVDCGGSCGGCGSGKSCGSGLDCASSWCDLDRSNVCCTPGASGCAQPSLRKEPTPWPARSGNFFRYAPEAIQVGNTRYTYWCGNRDSSNTTDYIIMRKDQWNGSGWVAGAEKVALTPGAPGVRFSSAGRATRTPYSTSGTMAIRSQTASTRSVGPSQTRSRVRGPE